MAFNLPPWFFPYENLTSFFFTLPFSGLTKSTIGSIRRLQGWAEPSKVLSVSALESSQKVP